MTRLLIPVIAQDADTGEVLMLAWADREALRRTLASGQAWYFSRSRQSYWHKGATSGHVQDVVAAHADCDSDAVLLRIQQTGPACHTGERSCFFRELELQTIDDLVYGHPANAADDAAIDDAAAADAGDGRGFLGRLEAVIAQRVAERPHGSYVAGLIDAGPTRPLQKVGEEAVEFALAAATVQVGGPSVVVGEAADLVFHLLVALRANGIEWAQVLQELMRRHSAAGSGPARETSPPSGT